MKDELHTLSKTFHNEIQSVTTIQEIDSLELKYLGRKGLLNEQFILLKSLSPDKKKVFGPKINAIKKTIEDLISSARLKLQTNQNTEFLQSIDTSIPGREYPIGHLHPTTMVIRKLNSFFRYYGYSVYEGPEIETNEYNFEKLNLPLDHPARELQDTLYIHEPEILLRTHTSSVETHALINETLPIRIVVPGRTYRNETANTTNNAMFYQYEGLYVDKNISFANLKGTLEQFVRFLYGENVKTRIRCKYYPQVEPGVGMDILCTFCKGKTCSVCKYRGWVEVLGAGMVHPNILTKCHINPEEYSGFAFGLGLDRLVMMSYNIQDIRELYNGELVVTSNL